MLLSVLQGLLLGMIMILPGMSGGTAFVILGIYEKLIKDLAKLNLLPWIPLFGGIVGGMLLGGIGFAFVFQNYRDITVAFLLGSIIASIRAVLQDSPRLNMKRLAFLIGGLVLGLYLGVEPLAIVSDAPLTAPHLLLIGGALSTAAMVIPGVPGSSVLIVMGIYDSLLLYVRELAFGQLFIYGIGCLIGLTLLVKILEKLYTHYRDVLAYFFAGLILGSTRALVPHKFNLTIAVLFLTGFTFVWFWSGRRVSAPPDEDDQRRPEVRSASSPD